MFSLSEILLAAILGVLLWAAVTGWGNRAEDSRAAHAAECNAQVGHV